jgi:hypothetical protein
MSPQMSFGSNSLAGVISIDDRPENKQDRSALRPQGLLMNIGQIQDSDEKDGAAN